MARVIEGYSQLRKDYDKYMGKMKISLLFTFISLLLIGWKSFFFFVMLGCILYAIYQYSLANEYKSGVTGERVMRAAGTKLPPKYTMVTNVELVLEGKSNLLDSVIVGPAGVFVVEMKNMNGRIIGDAYDYEWTQHKVGRGGGEYSKDVKNPIRALSYQQQLLSTLLKHHQLGVWVSGVVFFSNPSASVRVSGANIPVLSVRDKGVKKLKQMLVELEAKNQPLSEQAQTKAIAILTGKVS